MAQEVPECSDPLVANRLGRAIRNLCASDNDLFLVGVHERTISARLSFHLQAEFEGWHVDCEYNREGHGPKEVQLPEGVTRPYPDIIVHRRRQVGAVSNLLVVELKLSGNRNAHRERHDLAKLPAYVDSLGYQHAVYVKLATRPHQPQVLQMRWFEP